MSGREIADREPKESVFQRSMKMMKRVVAAAKSAQRQKRADKRRTAGVPKGLTPWEWRVCKEMRQSARVASFLSRKGVVL